MKMSTTAEQKHATAAIKVQLKINERDWLMLGVAKVRKKYLLFMVVNVIGN